MGRKIKCGIANLKNYNILFQDNGKKSSCPKFCLSPAQVQGPVKDFLNGTGPGNYQTDQTARQTPLQSYWQINHLQIVWLIDRKAD